MINEYYCSHCPIMGECEECFGVNFPKCCEYNAELLEALKGMVKFAKWFQNRGMRGDDITGYYDYKNALKAIKNAEGS